MQTNLKRFIEIFGYYILNLNTFTVLEGFELFLSDTSKSGEDEVRKFFQEKLG